MLFKHSLIALAFTLVTSVESVLGAKTCRIMPLGASITYGTGSSQGNGYRDDLYNLLEGASHVVNMVGSQKGGTFHDPDNEGYPGAIINEVKDKAWSAMPAYRPNIVTILVGTNDMSRNIDVGNAPARLGALIDDILNWEWLTLVVVSTLPPHADGATNDRINAYNAALTGVVQQRVDAGRSVVLVDSHAEIAVGDLVDGTHPNDAGYERMARRFYDGIKLAESKGWLFDLYGAPP